MTDARTQVTIPVIDKKMTLNEKQPTGKLRNGDVWLNPQTGFAYMYNDSSGSWLAIANDGTHRSVKDEIKATPKHVISDKDTEAYEGAMSLAGARTTPPSEFVKAVSKSYIESANACVASSKLSDNDTLSDLADVQFFTKKLERALKIPAEMLSKKQIAKDIGIETTFTHEFATQQKYNALPADAINGQEWLDDKDGKTYKFDAGLNLWTHTVRPGQMMIKCPPSSQKVSTIDPSTWTTCAMPAVDTVKNEAAIRVLADAIYAEFEADTSTDSYDRAMAFLE